MRIIDAHIHLHNEPYFYRIAEAAGHENSLEHLQKSYEQYNIAHAIIMSNRALDSEPLDYPAFLSYCVGLTVPGTIRWKGLICCWRSTCSYQLRGY